MPFLPPNQQRRSTEGNPSQSHRNVHALQPLREGKCDDLIILKSGRTQPIRRRRRRHYPTISWKRCITPE